MFAKVALGDLNDSVLWYRAGGALNSDEITDRTIALHRFGLLMTVPPR